MWNANPPTIKTSQLSAASGIIEQVMASGRRDGDRLRGSVVIDAEPGLGKTTIATRYARDFHRRVLPPGGPGNRAGHRGLPVAFVPLSAGITLKGLNQQILRFYTVTPRWIGPRRRSWARWLSTARAAVRRG